MMNQRHIPLERKAKANLDICCNSLCNSRVVEEYIEELENTIRSLRNALDNAGVEYESPTVDSK